MTRPQPSDERVSRMEFLLALRRRGITSAAVLRAMDEVPREYFVSPKHAEAAYGDFALPIACGQTISQPYLVAYMSEQLAVEPHHRVIEIGTGSGYQAAVLSLLTAEVYSLEIVPELARDAAATLARLGYTNVTTRVGDGYQGWEEHAPYDAIMVTAAPDHVPPALVAQLKPGGRLVVPVGQRFQELMLLIKGVEGGTSSTSIIPVKFVPLTRSQ